MKCQNCGNRTCTITTCEPCLVTVCDRCWYGTHRQHQPIMVRTDDYEMEHVPVEEAVAEYERELAMNPRMPGLDSGSANECEGVCFT